jgi:hypothetical protein
MPLRQAAGEPTPDPAVEVLAIVAKAQAQRWLAEQGETDANRGPGESEG